MMRTSVRTALIALSLLSPLSLLAASISGTVLDAGSGEPVRGVTVGAYTPNNFTAGPVVTAPGATPSDSGESRQAASVTRGTAITDRNGAFTIGGLDAGSYYLNLFPANTRMYRYTGVGKAWGGDDLALSADQEMTVGTLSLTRHPFVITRIKGGSKGATVTVLNNTDQAQELVFWANIGFGGGAILTIPEADYRPYDAEYSSEYTATSEPVTATLQPGSNTVDLRFRVPGHGLPLVTVYGGYSLSSPQMYPYGVYVY